MYIQCILAGCTLRFLVHRKEERVFSIAGIRHDSASFSINYFSYTVKKVSHLESYIPAGKGKWLTFFTVYRVK